MNCKHKDYQAKRRPRVNCEACWRKYISKHPVSIVEKPKGTWKLSGYDTFSGEGYSLYDDKGKPLAFPSLAKAQTAAKLRLEELERTQPSASSGGQGGFGIQDRVYIETPEGDMIRFTG